MRIMALDVGDKTVGIAMSDELEIIAQGLMTLERVGIRKDADKILELAQTNQCGKIVVGLPKNLNGTNSIQTDKVMLFHDMLANKIRSTGIKNLDLIYHDERFTTKIAEYVLIDANVSRQKRKEVIDKQAAVVILQSYLEQNRNK